MATLMDKQIRIDRTVTITTEQARAIGDPIRSKIVSMLYSHVLSAEEITEAVNRTGPEKALATVRHHMGILKTAGLIEVARIAESRGGVTKYYGTSTRLLGFEMPADFESTYSPVIDRTVERLEGTLGGVISDIAASGSKPNAEYSAYLAVEIINRAITKMLEKGKKRRGRKAPRSSGRTVHGTRAAESQSSDSEQGAGSETDKG